MREIIFDTETTGFDPRDGDRMVEIGCIEMVNRVLTGKTYHAYFNPERTMPAEAEAVHGLSDAFLADKPLFASCAEEFVAFIGDAPMIAHNAKFDFRFINFELERCNLAPVDLGRMVDTMELAKVRHPGAKLTLDALCSRYGIDRSHRTKHGALLDAELLAQVYVELRGGRQIGLELLADTAEVTAETRILVRKDRPFRQPRPHAATEEELLIHAEFLKSVEAPLWGA
ncbi:MAG: DNA polymerase III subunit epsilon [Novosphingobium pentaromativorans]|uniref:DNA polymerase III subunit epsilon n=1 Tax=Novosphingobium pentaromativorans TaxID=205844 RepID=A0A2W5NHP8_9SPHN|nr:DNA polymerase III subunit epsilon [Novosphingobium panipatense]PZQ53012.1 MAG: DNA polymerase III subunit epsilon [Novosphingobium pentaromativorans]